MIIIRNRHFKTKRLRKKYHQGEFKQLGFELKAQFIIPCPTLPVEVDEWMKKYVFEGGLDDVYCYLDSLGFEYGGGNNNWEFNLCISKCKGSCTAEDINNIVKFVDMTGIFKDITYGQLIDMWYDY